MALVCDLTIRFAAAGNSLAFLGGGWARSEENFTWGIGAESHLVFPRLEPAGEYTLTLDVIPFVHPPTLPNQRLIVSVNETVVGSAEINRPSLLGYCIPGVLAQESERMVVTLLHPDAACPNDISGSADDRVLSFALLTARLYRQTEPFGPQEHQLPAGLMMPSPGTGGLAARGRGDVAGWATSQTGLTLSQIALNFESLGENCEFGLFQRRCDAEPLGLLRFSSTFMRNLIRGIEEKFDGLGDVDDVEPRLEGTSTKEYMIHEKKFGLVYHTFIYEGQRSVWLMREQECARLKFLRRKFIEELEATDKIFVYKLGSAMSDEEILPLHLSLNRHAAAILLWVAPAERGRPCGTVEVLLPGLYKGYIDRFAPEDNAHDLSFDGWLQVCTNAYTLARLERRLGSTFKRLSAEDANIDDKKDLLADKP